MLLMHRGTLIKRSAKGLVYRYIGVVFHTFYYYWAEEYGSLYRRFFSIHFTITGLKNMARYTGVFVVSGSTIFNRIYPAPLQNMYHNKKHYCLGLLCLLKMVFDNESTNSNFFLENLAMWLAT